MTKPDTAKKWTKRSKTNLTRNGQRMGGADGGTCEVPTGFSGQTTGHGKSEGDILIQRCEGHLTRWPRETSVPDTVQLEVGSRGRVTDRPSSFRLRLLPERRVHLRSSRPRREELRRWNTTLPVSRHDLNTCYETCRVPSPGPPSFGSDSPIVRPTPVTVTPFVISGKYRKVYTSTSPDLLSVSFLPCLRPATSQGREVEVSRTITRECAQPPPSCVHLDPTTSEDPTRTGTVDSGQPVSETTPRP